MARKAIISAYFSGLPADLSTEPHPVAVVASRSCDGERSWPVPATVAPLLVGNELDAITGSPTLAGHAYLAWANFLREVIPRTNSLSFSRTTDRGVSWSRPVPIDQPSPFAIDFAPRILVLPDGTLLAVFARADLELGLFQFYAARSLDEGRTWLPPVLAAAKPFPRTWSIPQAAPSCRSRASPARRSPPTAASTSRSRTAGRRPRGRS